MRRAKVRVSGSSWRRRPTADLVRLSLSAFEAALSASDPISLIKKSVKRRGDTLRVDGKTFDLGSFDRVLVLGGGKASGGMAVALESILENRIDGGVVNVPDYLPLPKLRRVTPHLSTHPLPSETGADGVREMLRLVGRATEKDLCICLFSGGGSAMMPLPAPGLSVADKVKTTEELLKSGADIDEVNVVRRHISEVKGGRLAEKLMGATVLSLVISDVPNDRFETVSSGPTAPDGTTYADARRILAKYRAWEKVPETVRGHISAGEAGRFPENPEPGSPVFAKVTNVLIGSNKDSRLAAYGQLKKSGVAVVLREGFFRGEAAEVGRTLAKELTIMKPPAGHRLYGIVAGGEATVTVRGGGSGGRDQELVLSASRFLRNPLSSVSALATDGVDGPTKAAGAVADSTTVSRGKAKGLSVEAALAENDSHSYLDSLGDLLVSGGTGTNVNDVVVAIAAG